MYDTTTDKITHTLDWSMTIRVGEIVRKALAESPIEAHVAMVPANGGETNWLPCQIVGMNPIGDEMGWSIVLNGTAYTVRVGDILWGDE